jgi:hypothetical protein
MTNKRLLDKIDTIKSNSISNKEFEETWGESLDVKVEKSINKWNDLLRETKNNIKKR